MVLNKRNLETEKNLLVITAIEGYSMNHNISSKEALEIFNKNKMVETILEYYDTLHTQDSEEIVNFVEDILGSVEEC